MNSEISEPVVKSVQDLFIEQCYLHFTTTGSCYLHDIQSIDGFEVDVFLNRDYHKNIYLKIDSKNVFKNGKEFQLYHSDSFKIEGDKKLSDFKQTFYAVLMELQQLSFDKVLSKFLKKPAQIAMCEAFPELFINSKIVSAVRDCCVCYEKTRQITPCKHILCFPCWSQIKEIPEEQDADDDEDVPMIRPCPLCRADLDKSD